jgi:hypothetical protein
MAQRDIDKSDDRYDGGEDQPACSHKLRAAITQPAIAKASNKGADQRQEDCDDEEGVHRIN